MNVHLEEAHAIGTRYLETAIRARGEATWLHRFTPDDPNQVPIFPTLKTMEENIYGGTSGVALFLVQLGRQLKDPRFTELAREAALHAAKRTAATLERAPTVDRFGFYTGALGVAWTAALVSTEARSTQLALRAQSLVAQLNKAGTDNILLDIMAGAAGAIPALLQLNSMGFKGTIDLATRLGDVLVSSASWNGETASWANPRMSWPKNLTGFSHGTTGIGWALAKLFVATDDHRYRELAQAALAYDRLHFNAVEQNWPDYRRPQHDGSFGCMCMWCHGAPGIAMARADAGNLLKDNTLQQEARLGLATATSNLQTMLKDSGMNFQYCHGVAGNAESVSMAHQLLGDAPRAQDTMQLIGEYGIRRFGTQAKRRWKGQFLGWPVGMPGSPDKSLLRGEAGVGYFLLRAASPEAPTILLPGTR